MKHYVSPFYRVQFSHQFLVVPDGKHWQSPKKGNTFSSRRRAAVIRKSFSMDVELLLPNSICMISNPETPDNSESCSCESPMLLRRMEISRPISYIVFWALDPACCWAMLLCCCRSNKSCMDALMSEGWFCQGLNGLYAMM